MSNNFAPMVNVKTTNLEIGGSSSLSSLFDYLDLDNNPLQRLRFRDNGTAATSGFFSRNGVKVNANQWVEISAAELSTIRYHAGLIVGQETISIQAYDGRWGNAGTGTMLTVAQNFFAPTVTATNGSILSNEIRLVADLINATDRDGDSIVSYQFVDRQTNNLSGYFLLNGVRVAAGQWFTVAAQDLDKLRYVSASFGPYQERIGVMASDGKFWSSVTEFTMNTTENRFRPVVTASNAQGHLGASVEIRTLLGFSDQDGNTIKTVRLKDSGTANGSGFFTINGVPQPQGVWFTVNFADLSQVRYQYANQGEVEFFDAQISDGRFLSEIRRGQVSATPRPTIDAADTNIRFDALEQASVLSLINQSDNGPLLTKFQFLDQNTTTTSGKLWFNGSPLIPGRMYEFNAAQANNVIFESAPSDDGRTLDQIYVRGHNGLFWTDWQRLDMYTEPVANVALQSFGRWDNQTNGKTVVTYTFAEQPPAYYAPDSSEVTTFSAISPEARAAIRLIYQDIEKYANVRFVEVPWFSGRGFDAKTVWGMNTQTDSQGYAYGPIQETGLGNLIGDIWISDAGPTANDNPERGTRGSFAWLTYYHEIGHSMGFKHPFENGPILPPWMDDHQVTIMSYSSSAAAPPTGGNTGHVTTFTLYDVMEIQRLYGANTNYNSDNTQYRWDLGNTDLQILWDGGGNDTLNYGNQVAPATIDLRQGRYSSLNGRANALIMAFDAVIENARGSRNNDVIFGNEQRNLLFGGEGNDRLQGFGGNDVLRGGSGNDTYVWGLGDGRDSIREEAAGGVDVLEIQDWNGDFDSLAEDLTFWRTGTTLRDLRVELTFNNQQSIGGVTIFDMSNAASQVETLRIVDRDGNRVGRDIDLTSVFVGATDTKQRFRLTDFQGSHGFIAVPV